jgi:hypothetical protein
MGLKEECECCDMSGCCKSDAAEEIWRRKDKDGNFEYGGFVMCCCGKKVPCVRPGDCAGKMANKIDCICTIAHERAHINEGHVGCRKGDCNPHPVYPTERYGGGAGECAAYKATLDCLRRHKPLCNGNRECEREVERRRNSDRNYANDRYGCNL